MRNEPTGKVKQILKNYGVTDYRYRKTKWTEGSKENVERWTLYLPDEMPDDVRRRIMTELALADHNLRVLFGRDEEVGGYERGEGA